MYYTSYQLVDFVILKTVNFLRLHAFDGSIEYSKNEEMNKHDRMLTDLL